MKETKLQSLFKVKKLLSDGASIVPMSAMCTNIINAELEDVIFLLSVFRGWKMGQLKDAF